MGGIGIWKKGLALLTGLASMFAVPALAQEISAQEPDLAQLEQECDAGDWLSCKSLGDAYRDGEGAPRVAKVALILYTQACAADQAEACFAIGELYEFQRIQTLSAQPAGEHYSKACRLGLEKACVSLAALLQFYGDWDNPEALALVEQSCEQGTLAVCSKLAEYRLQKQGDAQSTAWAFSMLDALCSAQIEGACDAAISHARHMADSQPARLPVWLEVLCDRGMASRCAERARYAARDGLSPETTLEAQSFLDQACAIESLNCWPADALRDLPRVEALCLQGDEEACGQWGRYLQAENFVRPDRPAATALLSRACLAGNGQFCAEAVSLEHEFANPDLPEDATRLKALRQASCDQRVFWPCRDLVLEYLNSPDADQPSAAGIGTIESLCDEGVLEACNELADWYRHGNYVEKDLMKAASLFDRVCGTTDWRSERACAERDRLAILVPSLALPTAGADFLPIEPTPTEEELAALEAEDSCVLNWAIFRGQRYEELDCTDMVPRGRLSNPIASSRAPWQALLWRPVGERDLRGLQRVACGGTLIKDGWILTAAHCMAKSDIASEGYTVRLSVSNPTAPQGFEFPVEKAIPHPGFKRHGYAFDIGLIRYDPEKVTVHSWPYSPAAAALDEKPIGERTISDDMKVYAYGWGWTEVENSQPTKHLQSIPMKLSTLEDCEDLTQYRDRVRKNAVLCAAGDDGAQACFGDSGGGLFYYGDGAGPVLIGVVSAGKACGTTGLDSRYPRVAKVRDWIQREIAKYENQNRRPGR